MIPIPIGDSQLKFKYLAIFAQYFERHQERIEIIGVDISTGLIVQPWSVGTKYIVIRPIFESSYGTMITQLIATDGSNLYEVAGYRITRPITTITEGDRTKILDEVKCLLGI